MAIFHLHKRKRYYHPNLEDFPSKKKWKKILDNLVFVAGFISPLMVIPQAYEIWIEKQAGGVSVPAWIGFTLLAVIWLIYGIVHKEKAIIIMYTGLIFVDTLVFIGAIIYA